MVIQIFVWLFYAYLGLGLIIGLWLVFKGLGQIDAGLNSASWKLRLLLLPASIGLWPILLKKVISS